MAMWNRCAICGRAIPVGELCYGVKNWRGDPDGGDTICRDCLVPENAPTITPSNEPLTLEELREMDGEPVYIVFLPDVTGEKLQFWALVSVDEWGDVYLTNNFGGSSAYEEAWADIEAIYRRPPEGEPPHD